jgi:glutamate/tyrosine decarboxylase-like PLP-dependent enzyme
MPEEPVDLAALFLGPKAENTDVFERLLLEAFRDHVFWRRNFHPEDGFVIHEAERHGKSYADATAKLSSELMGLLGKLKDGVPSFSPRYVGHMCSDLTMASLVAYFATMLYNPNNVAAEASPVTTQLELEVAAELATMVGYSRERHWGHLTSGGTVANVEALWVARNLKYLPVALHWAAAELGHGDLEVNLPQGGRARIADMGLWELLNLTPHAALDAADELRRTGGPGPQVDAVLVRYSMESLGHQAFGLRLAKEFGDALPPAVVLVPSTAHYSWVKVCRTLGIGSAQLVHVPVDDRFRVDTAALWEILRALSAKKQPVMACVSVVGSTEESAVDRVDRVVDVNDRAARGLGMGFWLHADAAWGGYAASVTREHDGGLRRFEDFVREEGDDPCLTEGVYRALSALCKTDSVTIDPHKLGYVPYPAGSVSFRDKRVRSLISTDAPYAFTKETSEVRDLGRFIFEGSKPGAAAAGVWMSHQMLPLDRYGHGRLVREGVRGAKALHLRLGKESWGAFHLVLLPEPDLNIVCFGFTHPSLKTLEATNAFASRVHEHMSVGPGRTARSLDYIVTNTVLRFEEYGRAVEPLVTSMGFDPQDYARAGGVTVIRCTVMNPLLTAKRGAVDFLGGFVEALRQALHDSL